MIGGPAATVPSPDSSRVGMRAHHIRVHGVSSDPGRASGPGAAGNASERSGMTDRPASSPDRSEAGRYEIRLTGHLDAHWTAWFDGLTVSREANGTTVISGLIVD